MPKSYEPQRLSNMNCTRTCSLSVEKLGEDKAGAIHRLFEAGTTYDDILRAAAQMGVETSRATLARHRANHLRPETEPETYGDEEEGPFNLRETIQVGLRRAAKNAPNWKPTLADFIALAKLDIDLNGGADWNPFFEAMDSVGEISDYDWAKQSLERLTPEERERLLNEDHPDAELEEDDVTAAAEGYR